MSFIKNFFRSKTNLFSFLVGLLLSYILFPNELFITVKPIMSIGYLWNSIDASWMIAINYANNFNLIWGEDICFTYGPLGFFSTRIAWGVDLYKFLLYDFFIAINIFYLGYYSFKNYKNKILICLLVLLIILFIPNYLVGSNSIILFFLFIFWIRTGVEESNIINSTFQIALLVLLFFIKFNTSIISLLIFTIYLLYVYTTKKKDLRYVLISFFTPIFLIFCFSFVLNVNLKGYFFSGIQLIKGYNEIMYIDENPLLFSSAFIFMLFSSGFFFYKLFKSPEKMKDGLILFLFSVAMYILFKQSFVRADNGHIHDFFTFIPLLLLAIQFFSNDRINRYSLVLISAFFLTITFFNFENFKTYNLIQNINKSKYFSSLSEYNLLSGMYLFPNNNQLPKNIIDRIGKNKVDVYPWNIRMLIENNLNYSPRPVLQSYSTYTEYLEDLNNDCYNSELNSPKFVIYDYAAIENRHPIFDESKVNLNLFKNYKVVEKFNHNQRDLLLFERKENFRPINLEFLKSHDIEINQEFMLEPNKYYKITVNNNFIGFLYSLIKFSPKLEIDVDGKTYRTSKSLLESGIFSTSNVNRIEDLDMQINNNLQDKIKIKIAPDDEMFFNKSIEVTEYKITQ